MDSSSSSSLFFLEDWLRDTTSPISSSAAATRPSAPQIAHLWAQLRDCVHHGVLLEPHHLSALMLLRDCGRSLHVAEPQVRLLIPILSSVTCTEEAQDLAQARSCAAFLLSIWVRRSSISLQSNKALGQQSQEIMTSLVENTAKALEDHRYIQIFIGEAILLLGALSSAAKTPQDLRGKCQQIVALQCLERRNLMRQGRLEEALAGIGYTMISSQDLYLVGIIRVLISLWSGECESQDDEYPPIKDMLMLLHLMEWYASAIRQQTGAIVNIQVIVEELSQAVKNYATTSVKCALVMCCAGLLKILYIRVERASIVPSYLWAEPNLERSRRSLELIVANMADDALQSQGSMIEAKIGDQAIGFIETTSTDKVSLLQQWLYESGLSRTTGANRHWLQCTAIAVARCKGFPSRPSILLGLAVTLLNDVIPVAELYTTQLMDFIHYSTHEYSEKGQQDGNEGRKFYSALEDLNFHVAGVLFQEVGAITRAMCEQYQSVGERFQILIENILWAYSRVFYESHRLYVTLQHQFDFKKRSLDSFSLNPGGGTLNKILEAVFLSIVMFFSSTLKGRSRSGERTSEVAVLDSFSCVEFFRHVKVPEYGATVLDCISKIASSDAAATFLVQTLPSYGNVIGLPGKTGESISCFPEYICRLIDAFQVLACSNETGVNRIAQIVSQLDQTRRRRVICDMHLPCMNKFPKEKGVRNLATHWRQHIER